MKLRNSAIITAAALVMVVAVVFSLFIYLNSQPALEVKSMVVGVPPNEQSALIFIAEDQQFFLANGLNATVKIYASALAALDGLLNKEVDISQTAELPIVSKAFTEESISVVASIDRFQNMFLVCRKDKGVNEVSDLRGKTIGSAKGTLTEFHLGRFLTLNGISLQDVTVKNIPFAQSAEALANGTVDAFQAQNRDLPAIKARLGEENLVIWSSQSGQPGFELVSGRTGWVETNSDTVVRFLKSLAQAEQYITEHPTEALAIIQRKLGYDDEYMATIRSQHTYSLSLDQALILAMEDEARWLISNNSTSATRVPDFQNYIYLEGLATVKPNSVTIIR